MKVNISDRLEDLLAASERRQQERREMWPAPLPEETKTNDSWWSYVLLYLFLGPGSDYIRRWTGWREWIVFLVVLVPVAFCWQSYRMGGFVTPWRWWPVIVAAVAVFLYYFGK